MIPYEQLAEALAQSKAAVPTAEPVAAEQGADAAVSEPAARGNTEEIALDDIVGSEPDSA